MQVVGIVESRLNAVPVMEITSGVSPMFVSRQNGLVTAACLCGKVVAPIQAHLL